MLDVGIPQRGAELFLHNDITTRGLPRPKGLAMTIMTFKRFRQAHACRIAFSSILHREVYDLFPLVILLFCHQSSHRICHILLHGVGHVHIGVHREARIGVSEHM